MGMHYTLDLEYAMDRDSWRM